MRNRIAVIALAGLIAAVPAGADAAKYKGKTKGGSKITMKVSKGKASKIKTAVPMICVETTGSGQTRAGIELFQPPGKYEIGKTTKRKALQRSAMNNAAKTTKNYTVTLKRKAGKVKGKLKLSLSFLRPDLFSYLPDTFICSGSTTFTAK